MGNRQIRQMQEEMHNNAESIRNLAIVLRRVNNELTETKAKLEEAKESFDNEKDLLMQKIEMQNSVLDELQSTINTLEENSARKHDYTKLTKMISEAKEGLMKDKSEIPYIVKQTIIKNRKEWDEAVLEMQERYQETKSGIRETISLDLEHERGIHELKKKYEFLEGKHVSLDEPQRAGKVTSTVQREGTSSTGRSRRTFSHIGLKMKKLREDMKISYSS